MIGVPSFPASKRYTNGNGKTCSYFWSTRLSNASLHRPGVLRWTTRTSNNVEWEILQRNNLVCVEMSVALCWLHGFYSSGASKITVQLLYAPILKSGACKMECRIDWCSIIVPMGVSFIWLLDVSIPDNSSRGEVDALKCVHATVHVKSKQFWNAKAIIQLPYRDLNLWYNADHYLVGNALSLTKPATLRP